MKQELIKYAEGLGADQKILKWLKTHVFSQENINQSEVEHVIDYLVSDKAPKNLSKASLAQMKANTKKWTAALTKKGNNIEERPEDIETIIDFKNGFKFVKLIGKNAYQREGFLMRHCVNSYFDKNDEIYSLRDGKNMPHATISKSLQQIKGKGNGSIHLDYIQYIVQFLEFLKIEVRDSEMANLGYSNYEMLKPYIENKLYRDKYFYKLDELKSKKNIIICFSIDELLKNINNLKIIVYCGDLYLEGYTHPLPQGFTHCGGYLDLRSYTHPLPQGFIYNKPLNDK